MARLPIKVIRLRVLGVDRECVTVVPPDHDFSGQIPSQSIIGALTRPLKPDESITPGIFAVNKVFVDFMHHVIALHGGNSPTIIAEAKRHKSGYVYIADQRYAHTNVVVPPTELIGAFEVKGGRIIPGSYLANPQHAILSSLGFMQLEDTLMDSLMEAIVTVSPSQVGR